jgi:hypothetical protein
VFGSLCVGSVVSAVTIAFGWFDAVSSNVNGRSVACAGAGGTFVEDPGSVGITLHFVATLQLCTRVASHCGQGTSLE